MEKKTQQIAFTFADVVNQKINPTATVRIKQPVLKGKFVGVENFQPLRKNII